MSDVEDFVARVFLRRRPPKSPVAKAVGIINGNPPHPSIAIGMDGTPDRSHEEFMMEADIGPAFPPSNEIQFLVVHRNKKLQTRDS